MRLPRCATSLLPRAGKRLSAEEKAAWHLDVNVRFQPKAWYDEEQCELYALNEMKEITAKARAAKEESLAIFDNLSGQTTAQHLKNLRKNKCKRHLLPGGMTDSLQLVDDGIGFSLKHEMGNQKDEWLMLPGNLELWTAEGKGGFPVWKKRALLTQFAARAWEKVCARFDFEKAATRLGMRMTIDGTNDQLIKVKGIDNYTFSDANGGAAGAESDDEGADPEEEEEENADVVMPDSSDEEEGEEDDEYEGGDSSEDEEDDTAESVSSMIGNAVAPKGYKVIDELPPLDSEDDLNNLIGKPIVCGWEQKADNKNKNPIVGWYTGTVHSRNLSTTDKKNTPTANFAVKYTSAKTDKKLNGSVACELTARTHGASVWWVLLQKE